MRVRLTGLLMVSLLAGGLSSSGQPQVNYGPFVPTQEWGLIMKELLNGGTRAKGVADMRAFAERNKGTTTGAHALATAGLYCEDDVLYRELLQQIISEYPNSGFSAQANIALANLTPHPNHQAWLAARDQLLQSLGAPTLVEILRNRRAAVAKARSLPLDTLNAVMQTYQDYANILRKAERYRDAITVCQFGDEAAFQKHIPVGFSGIQGYCFNLLTTGTSTAFDRVLVNPDLRVRSPQPNRKSGRRPSVSFEIRTGDYRHYQAMFPTVWLDGQEISALMDRQSKLNLKRKTGPNVFYEQCRYSYRPSKPLSNGRHTLSVSVVVNQPGEHPPGSPGRTDVTWSFFVDSRENSEAGHDDEGSGDDDFGCNEEKD